MVRAVRAIDPRWNGEDKKEKISKLQKETNEESA